MANLLKQAQKKDQEIQTLIASNMTLKSQTIALQEHIVTLENLVNVKNDFKERLKNSEDKITVLNAKDQKSSKRISELETIIESDAKRALELEQRIDSLRFHSGQKDQVSFSGFF